MAILDDLAAPPARALNFWEWLAEQTDEVQAALVKAATDRRWSNYALAQTIRANDGPCSKETIAKWRTDLGFKG